MHLQLKNTQPDDQLNWFYYVLNLGSTLRVHHSSRSAISRTSTGVIIQVVNEVAFFHGTPLLFERTDSHIYSDLGTWQIFSGKK